jgi:hypothetical protein
MTRSLGTRAMATLQNLESAKIIQFPLQRRLGVATGTSAASQVVNEAERPLVTYDAWYHDAAIREERTRKQ